MDKNASPGKGEVIRRMKVTDATNKYEDKKGLP
jgi:hypothetical protein